jgi:hypothetical protein
MSTAYHPQTDRQTERVNQSLEQYLRIFGNKRQDDWAQLLSTAEFAYNNATHEATKLSPFFVEYGRNPRMAPDVAGIVHHPSLEEMFNAREEAQEQAKAALTLAADRAKWYFDLHKSEVPFKVGDKVLLNGENLQIKVRTTKLATKNYGPYEILEQLGPVTFKLKLPKSMKIHPVFHALRLIPYHTDTTGSRPTTQHNPDMEAEEEYTVEKILDSEIMEQRGRPKVWYKVKWKGYDDPSEDTWEPLRNLKHLKKLLQDFHRANPDRPMPLNWTNATPIHTLYERKSIVVPRVDGAPL